jgi:hypothetical protein
MKERDYLLTSISRKSLAGHYKERGVLLTVESMSSIVSNLDGVRSGSNATASILEKRENPSSNDRAKLSQLPRIKSIIKHFFLVVLASIAIELVMIFSFNFLDGFVLTQTTLAVGTSVYVLDSVIKR